VHFSSKILPHSVFDSHFTKSLFFNSQSAQTSLSSSLIQNSQFFTGPSLVVEDCIFDSISSNLSALSFESTYDPLIRSLGKAAIRSSIFNSCHGSQGGAFCIWRGLLVVSDVCVSACTSNGSMGNALSVFDATSIIISLTTITLAGGSGLEAAHLFATYDTSVSSANYSHNFHTLNDGTCGGFSLKCDRLHFGFTFHELLVDRVGGSTFLSLDHTANSSISSSVFVLEIASDFRCNACVTFATCTFLGSPLGRAPDSRAAVTFRRCGFSLNHEPQLPACDLDLCHVGVETPPSLRMLNTAVCRARFADGSSGGWLVPAIILVALVAAGLALAHKRSEIAGRMRVIVVGVVLLRFFFSWILTFASFAGIVFLFAALVWVTSCCVAILVKWPCANPERADLARPLSRHVQNTFWVVPQPFDTLPEFVSPAPPLVIHAPPRAGDGGIEDN
jgi:hypothetical protein